MQQVVNNFGVFMKKAWKIDKKYFLYLLLSFTGVGVFSYYTIQIPKIVLGMIESSAIDIQRIIFIFSILLFSAILSSLSKVLYTPIGNKIRYQYLLQISEQYISIPYEEYDNQIGRASCRERV